MRRMVRRHASMKSVAEHRVDTGAPTAGAVPAVTSASVFNRNRLVAMAM